MVEIELLSIYFLKKEMNRERNRKKIGILRDLELVEY